MDKLIIGTNKNGTMRINGVDIGKSNHTQFGMTGDPAYVLVKFIKQQSDRAGGTTAIYHVYNKYNDEDMKKWLYQLDLKELSLDLKNAKSSSDSETHLFNFKKTNCSKLEDIKKRLVLEYDCHKCFYCDNYFTAKQMQDDNTQCINCNTENQ